MKQKNEFGQFFSPKRAIVTVSEEGNFPQKKQGGLDNKNWRHELIQLLQTSHSVKKAANFVKQAGLKDHHYPALYELLSLNTYISLHPFIFPWQLQLLTGEACYLMPHLLKKDSSGNTVAHYAVAVGAGPEILEKIRKKDFSLLLAKNKWHQDLLFFAFRYKNKPALEWLLKETPELALEAFEQPAHQLWFLVKKNAWPEGLELMAESSHFNLPMVLPINQLYNLPTVCDRLKERKQFPFCLDPQKDFKAIFAMLTSKWEHPVSKMEWCKANITGFTNILKKARDPSNRDTLLNRTITEDIPDRDLFTSIVLEAPELLDEKDSQGRSLAGCALDDDDFRLFNFVLSFSNCTTLHGISFDDECCAESNGDIEPEELAEEGLDRLNEALFKNYTIQRVYFTHSTKRLLAEYLSTSEKIPSYLCYLERNKLLLLLFVGMNDNCSFFTSVLNLDVMSLIINKLIELSPPKSELFLTSQSPLMVKAYENQMNQIRDFSEEENQLQNIILLLLSSDDKGCDFSSYLRLDMIKIIINKLTELTPIVPRHFFTNSNRYRFDDYSKILTKKQKDHDGEEQDEMDSSYEEMDSSYEEMDSSYEEMDSSYEDYIQALK